MLKQKPGEVSAGNNEASLEDLHPDGASVRNFSWPWPCFLGTSEYF